MSKRFTDNGMWKKKWFRGLTPAEKAAWFYIKDECDNVGVWVPDFELAEFQIGASVDWENLPSKTNGNIEVLPNGKWFLVDFCGFQYGPLKTDPKNKPHQSYLKLLDYHGLTDRVSIDYDGTIHSPKDKDKDKDKDMDTDKEKDESPTLQKSRPKDIHEVKAYCAEIEVPALEAEKFMDHYTANGWVQGRNKPIKDWKAAVRNWKRNMNSYSGMNGKPKHTDPVYPVHR